MVDKEMPTTTLVGLVLLCLAFIIESGLLAKGVWTEGILWWVKSVGLIIISEVLAFLFAVLIDMMADALENKYDINRSFVWVLVLGLIALALSKVHSLISWTTVISILAVAVVSLVVLYYSTRKKEPGSGEEEGEPSWFSKNWPFVLVGAVALIAVLAYFLDWLSGTTAVLIALIAILAGIGYYRYTHRKEEPASTEREERTEAPKNKSRMWLYVGLCIALFSILAGIYFLWPSGEKAPTPADIIISDIQPDKQEYRVGGIANISVVIQNTGTKVIPARLSVSMASSNKQDTYVYSLTEQDVVLRPGTNSFSSEVGIYSADTTTVVVALDSAIVDLAGKKTIKPNAFTVKTKEQAEKSKVTVTAETAELNITKEGNRSIAIRGGRVEYAMIASPAGQTDIRGFAKGTESVLYVESCSASEAACDKMRNASDRFMDRLLNMLDNSTKTTS